MTKTQAIKRARAEVTEYSTWCEDLQAWWSHSVPAGKNAIQDLKERRIQYALELLGVDDWYIMLYIDMHCHCIPFRDAVYSYNLRS